MDNPTSTPGTEEIRFGVELPRGARVEVLNSGLIRIIAEGGVFVKTADEWVALAVDASLSAAKAP